MISAILPVQLVDPDRIAAVESLRHLLALLQDETDIERVLDGYVLVRSDLAASFERLIEKTNTDGSKLMEESRKNVLDEMSKRFEPIVPDYLLFVKKYSGIHQKMLGYFATRLGVSVPAARVRVLTGDQVHTERRLRELRDLGFELLSAKISGSFQYTLTSLRQNLVRAAHTQITTNINECKKLSPRVKEQLRKTIDSIEQ